VFGLENLFTGWKLLVLILLGIFVFGPDRLPVAIADGVRMLRKLRDMARDATGDLSRELGTEVTLEDLHPKTFLRKHLLSEDDERALRAPLDSLYGDLRRDTGALRDEARQAGAALRGQDPGPALPPGAPAAGSGPAPRPGAARRTFDADAT